MKKPLTNLIKTLAITGLSALAVLGSEKSGLSQAFPKVMANTVRIESSYARVNSTINNYANYLENRAINYGRINTNLLAGCIGAALGYALTRTKKIKID
jgi:hypothetical protein